MKSYVESGVAIQTLYSKFTYNHETGVISHRKGRLNGRPAGATRKDGYKLINVAGTRILAHRTAWAMYYGQWPEGDLDHINHNPSDNRIENLRMVDCAENMRNRGPQKNTSTRIMGVSFDKSRGQWRIAIKKNRQYKNLGRTKDFFEACCIRKSAERKMNFHLNHGNVVDNAVHTND